MNYSERENAIGSILKIHILPRYKRPEHLDTDQARAELADMVNDLNAEWPVVPQDAFMAIGERFARELRKIATSRTWPNIGTMLRALDAAKDQPGEASAEIDPDMLYGRIVQFWKQCRAVLKSAWRDEFADRLVNDGHATWGDLQWHGFPLNMDQRLAGERENTRRYADLVADLHESTEHLRQGGAPRGSIRTQQEPA